MSNRHRLVTVVSLATVAGCSLLQRAPRVPESVNLIAVLPIERTESAGATAVETGPRLTSGAERVVTAQIYDVLSGSHAWRFVADLTVSQALGKLSSTGSLETRARALGSAVGADAVLFGTVSRYVERVGTEYGAREPASVSFTLQLLSVSSGKLLWSKSFDETQRPLTSNLFNWWQFWRGGPRWFSAQEFTHLGVEHLLEDLAPKLGY